MTILQSWKESLRLLGWRNAKLFVSSVWSVVPALYGAWFKHCLVPFLIVFGLIPFMPAIIKYAHEHSQPILLVGIFGIVVSLLSYATTVLYVVTQQILHAHTVDPLEYEHHELYCVMTLGCLFSAIVYWFYTCIASFIATAGMHGVGIPLVNNDTLVSNIKTFAYGALALSDTVTLSLFIAMLFFFACSANIENFFMSILRMFGFIMYNLPMIVIIYAILTLIGFPAGIALNNLIDYGVATQKIDVIVMAIFGVWILFLPLCLAAYGCYFYKHVKE